MSIKDGIDSRVQMDFSNTNSPTSGDFETVANVTNVDFEPPVNFNEVSVFEDQGTRRIDGKSDFSGSFTVLWDDSEGTHYTGSSPGGLLDHNDGSTVWIAITMDKDNSTIQHRARVKYNLSFSSDGASPIEATVNFSNADGNDPIVETAF